MYFLKILKILKRYLILQHFLKERKEKCVGTNPTETQISCAPSLDNKVARQPATRHYPFQ